MFNFFIPRQFPWPTNAYICNGQIYEFIAGFGAQLVSYEWRVQPAGTTRTIFNRKFRVFTSKREWLRARTTWTMLDGVESKNHLKVINKFREELRDI